MKEELRYAGFWIRVFTVFIDVIMWMAISYPSLYFVYGKEIWNKTDFILGPADFIISWIFPFVLTLLLWNYYQATPGKMLINAKIVDSRTGKKPSFRQFIIRYRLYSFVCGFPVRNFCFVAYLEASKKKPYLVTTIV